MRGCHHRGRGGCVRRGEVVHRGVGSAAPVWDMRQREARNLRSSLLQRLRKDSKIDVNDRVLTQGQAQNDNEQS